MKLMGRPAKNPRTDFGERLYEARIGAGFTQKEIAEKFGVTQAFVAFWERKGKSLPADLLNELAKLYNVSVDELVGRTKDLKHSNVPVGRLKRSFDKAAQLSRRQQEKISEVVDALVEKHERNLAK